MAGEIRFRPIEADYVAVRRDTYRQCLCTRPLRLVYGALPVLLMLIGLTDAGSDPVRLVSYAIGYGLIGLAISGMMIATSWAIIPARSRRLFRQTKMLHQEFDYSWSDAGLRFASATGNGDIPWPMLHGWARSRSNILLYLSPAMCHFLPLRVMADAQAGDLETTLAGAGVRRL